MVASACSWEDDGDGRERNLMKNFIMAAAGLAALGFAAPASAADLAARPYAKAPPPMMVAVYDWTGFYVGANAGYGWSNRCLNVNAVNGVNLIGAEGCRDAGGRGAGGLIRFLAQSAKLVF